MEDLTKHLYSRKLKSKTSYFTQIDGKYIPLGSNEAAARLELQRLLGADTGNTIEFMCRSYIAKQRQLLKDGSPNALAPRTVDDYEDSLIKFVLPVFGKMRPSDFDPGMKAQYLDQAVRDKRGVRGNREMSALGSAFNHGMVLRMVKSNPTLGAKRNREHPRKREVTVAEFNAFMAFAKVKGGSQYLVGLIGALVGLTGRRRAEILALPMSAITDEGIRCRSSKVKAGEAPRYYLIEDSPLIRTLVQEARSVVRMVNQGKTPMKVRVTGSLFLFANMDGQPYKDSGFGTLWQRLMVSYSVETGAVRFTAHDLRAMYISLTLGAKGRPETHQNEATMRKVYDRRREIKVTPLG